MSGDSPRSSQAREDNAEEDMGETPFHDVTISPPYPGNYMPRSGVVIRPARLTTTEENPINGWRAVDVNEQQVVVMQIRRGYMPGLLACIKRRVPIHLL